MSFRKYGGLDRAATNNIVRSNYATANNESITDALGLENSRIVCKSDLDMNSNSIINLESIYFIDNAYIYSNNLTIEGNLTIDGNLVINGNIEIGEDLTVDRDLFVKRYAYIDDNATFGKSIIMNGPIGNYIEFPDNTKQYTASLASPIGSITMYGGITTPPTSYLFCNGSAYNTTTYQSLFAIIGYTYGGSGASFMIPNLQQRFPVGAQTQSQMSITVNGSPSGVNGGSDALVASDIPSLSVSVTTGGSITTTVTTPGNGGFFSAAPSFNNSVKIPSAGAADTVLKTDSNGYTPTVTINNDLSYSGAYTNSSQTQTYPKFTVVNYIIKYQ